MLGSVVAMAVTGAHCAYEKTTEEDRSAVRFSEYDGSENQLWTFKPADNSAEPEYRLVNVKTGKYLTVCSFVVSSKEADAENVPTVFKALRIDGRDESPLYTFSSDAGNLSYAGGRVCADNSSAAKFRLLSFADGLPAALSPSGTYAVPPESPFVRNSIRLLPIWFALQCGVLNHILLFFKTIRMASGNLQQAPLPSPLPVLPFPSRGRLVRGMLARSMRVIAPATFSDAPLPPSE